MREFFHRHTKFRPRATDEDGSDQQVPDDLWVKCPRCRDILYSKELDDNERVCPKCGYHFRLRARERVAALADPDSFVEWDAGLTPEDPLLFADGGGPYDRKLVATQAKSGEREAVISGQATIAPSDPTRRVPWRSVRASAVRRSRRKDRVSATP